MDERLFFLINGRWHSSALDRIMAAASSLDAWLPVIVLAVLLTAWLGKTRARLFLLTLALSLAIGDGLVSNGLKHLVHRPRPFQAVADVRQVELARARPRLLALFQPSVVKQSAAPQPPSELNGGRSFPSSHTVNNFCAAMLLALFYRCRGALFFLVAGLVAYSRIYVGSHWPSDVLVSAVLGSGIALLVMAIVQAGFARFVPMKRVPG